MPALKAPFRSLFVLSVTAVMLLGADRAEARRRPSHSPEPVFNAAWTEGGYADQTSVRQGSPIRFHIATSVSPFSMRVVNLAHPDQIMLTRTLTSAPRNCSGRGSSGCGWPVTTTIDVPGTWAPGYYAATFPTSFGDRSIIFVVRDRVPGSWSRTVVVQSTHTYQAYNEYGGRSFYPTVSTGGQRLTALSFDRPYANDGGLGRYLGWESTFVQWMTQENRRFEVITDVDLEDPTALAPYDVVVLVGHSEYWTATARANLEQFSSNGNHIAVLGGNTMWWQVRLQDNGRTLVGFKSAITDPVPGAERQWTTTNWFAHPVNLPENRLFGASYRNGGYANEINVAGSHTLKPVEQRTPWTVTDAQHWIYAGANVSNGSQFGRESTGLEVDGVVFNCDTNGRVLGPDGSDESPRNYHILATVPGDAGWGTMGIYVNSSGGAVFNAASQGWVWGLANDHVVRTVTSNVLNRFATGAPLPYDPAQTTVLAQHTFNCPATLIAQPGWRGNVGRGTVTSACAYEGPGGLELSGKGVIAIARSFTRVEEPRDHVELRFYLNADAAEQRAPFPMSIVTLRHAVGPTATNVASVELEKTGDTRRIRLARRGPNEFRASEFVTISNGWHLVEVSWRSPGTLTLQVDGGTPISLENPNAGQRVNDVIVGVPEAESEQVAGRICIDAIGVGSQKLGSVPALRDF